MTTDLDILRYWHASLADNERMGLNYGKLKGAFKVHFSQVLHGCIGPEATERYFEKLAAKDKTPRSKPIQEDMLVPGEVLICPLVAEPQREHGRTKTGQMPIAPLWIPATLLPDGTLEPITTALPWISRDLLEPVQSGNVSVTIGLADDVDRFLTAYPFPAEAAWSLYWRYCDEFLHAVCGQTIEQFTVNDYSTIRDTAFLLPYDKKSDTAHHIFSLYEHLLSKQEMPPLLKSYSSLSMPPTKPLLTEVEWQKASHCHVGQMTGMFSLSESQREALHHFLNVEDGDILAVTGPPGTGKTTMLQSVIATLWVEAALHKKEPPIIVAASANRQAVKNVIREFGSVGVNEQSERWLPLVKSYGLYCGSETDNDIEGLQAIFPGDKVGFFTPLEDTQYLVEARRVFLQKCRGFFGRTFSEVLQARDALNQGIHKVTGDIVVVASIQKEIGDIEQSYAEQGGIEEVIADYEAQMESAQCNVQEVRHNLQGWHQSVTKRPLWMIILSFVPSVNQQIALYNKMYFDTTGIYATITRFDDRSVERFLEQQLSDAEKRIQKVSVALSKTQADNQKLEQYRVEWNDLCKLYGIDESETLDGEIDKKIRFKAFELATHYWEADWLTEMETAVYEDPRDWSKETVERRWRRYAKLTPCFASTLYMVPRFFSSQYKPLLTFIDLLIIDEAGQVSPEVGAAIFALAKKALVVGDVHQIEPVTQLNKAVDNGNLKRCAVIDGIDETQLEYIRKRIGASESSVMVVAQDSSYYAIDDRERGLLLTEHRRCVPEIIEYCNELAYKGKLRKKRESIASPILPFMGYANIPGMSKQEGGSRYNETEAAVIAAWLRDKGSEIEEYYGDSLENIVGIVTPFKKQAEVIGARVASTKEEFLKGITIGTVHAFQGSERRVMIFSPVYHESCSFFFDRSVNMLNVAVSRAKDSFLVFGNMSIFEINPFSKRPSSLLAKYLFANDANELTDIHKYPMRLIDFPRTTTEHLITLEDHTTKLRECIENARERVFISSPQLSINAVRDDKLENLIRQARNRGVDVVIYTDQDLNRIDDKEKYTARQAREALQRCGADIRIVSRVHSKTLGMDNKILVEGSFNWCSARRDPSHPHQRYEASFCYEGKDVNQMIEMTMRELESRRLTIANERRV